MVIRPRLLGERVQVVLHTFVPVHSRLLPGTKVCLEIFNDAVHPHLAGTFRPPNGCFAPVKIDLLTIIHGAPKSTEGPSQLTWAFCAFGSLELGVVSATRRKFFTTDAVWAGNAHNTDYTDFFTFFCANS